MKWLRISDVEPPLYDGVLVSDGECVDIGFMQSDGDFCFAGDYLDNSVAYWSELPEPPKEDET